MQHKFIFYVLFLLVFGGKRLTTTHITDMKSQPIYNTVMYIFFDATRNFLLRFFFYK